MPTTFDHTFDNASYKGSTSFNTGLFINGEVRGPSSLRSSGCPLPLLLPLLPLPTDTMSALCSRVCSGSTALTARPSSASFPAASLPFSSAGSLRAEPRERPLTRPSLPPSLQLDQPLDRQGHHVIRRRR